MKNRKWIRLVALALTVALLAGTALSVGAMRTVSDVNGDGKITVFDAQMIAESNAGKRTLTDTQKAAAGNVTIEQLLNYIFGDTAVDTGDMNGDGIHEIYTAEGLQALQEAPAASYILMNDLDLGGADWTPIQNFSGSLNGNGYTISNFTINASVADTKNDTIYNLGFFGDTAASAVISDLHLADVTVNADANACFIGFFAGTLRGQLTGCTVVGTLNDSRETYPTNVYTGIMVGRLTINSGGSIVGGTGLSYTDEVGKYTTSGLCANVKLFLTNEDVNLQGDAYNKVGLAGYAPSGYTVTGQWVDTSHSSSLLSQTIQARQTKIVDYMTAMASVKWTPAEDWTYTASNGTDQTYKAGTVYTGLPYNGRNGSLERFMSVMGSQDENGVYTSVSGLGSNCGYDAETGTWSDSGFYLIMGNDCSSAVGWAWMQVSNVRVADGPVTGEGAHNTPYKGGVYVKYTTNMVPNETNRATYGVYPVGGWTQTTAIDPATGKLVSAEFDTSKAAYQCTDQTYTADVLAANGKDTILEAYAQTHKADALVVYVSNWSSNVTIGGHARLVAADPVVIRNADGTIDADASYMLLTEQGVGFTDTSTTHWNIEKKHTFNNLAATDADGNVTTSSKTYLPITMRALKEDNIRETYLISNPSGSITSPVSGGIYSYNRINSVTVTVSDADDNVYYDYEAFTGISSNASIHRGTNHSVTLADLHGNTFATAAAQTGMVEGNTYYFTVDVLLSTGEVVHLVPETSFVYTTETAE